ncbi:MAG: hypothetical protein AAGU32_14085 [Bacillota bacterium]
MLRGELFSGDMVKAYLENRKSHTCRPIKCKYSNTHIKWRTDKYGQSLVEMQSDVEGETFWKNEDGTTTHQLLAYRELKPKHRPGDYIYCRETWGTYSKDWQDSTTGFLYRADYPDGAEGYWHEPEHINWCDLPKWRPSIHMPREAARLFFRVTRVEVMRLEDVTEEFARGDGFQIREGFSALVQFKHFWRQTYGPDARWMWVYWTEPCSREEALGDAI